MPREGILQLKIGCGTDIIEINRIKHSIEEFGEAFINTIFTEKEVKYCESKKNSKFQHYAARFAAKEAIYKAISNCNEKIKANFLDAEIINSKNGKPKVVFLNELSYLNQAEIDISISHCKEYAIAMVIIITQEEK